VSVPVIVERFEGEKADEIREWGNTFGKFSDKFPAIVAGRIALPWVIRDEWILYVDGDFQALRDFSEALEAEIQAMEREGKVLSARQWPTSVGKSDDVFRAYFREVLHVKSDTYQWRAPLLLHNGGELRTHFAAVWGKLRELKVPMQFAEQDALNMMMPFRVRRHMAPVFRELCGEKDCRGVLKHSEAEDPVCARFQASVAAGKLPAYDAALREAHGDHYLLPLR
jgi:hypothetical protein